jgi:anti-sigma B factor antagonist
VRPLTLHSPTPTLQLHRREADGIVIFEVHGTLDLFTSPQLRAGLHAAVAEGYEGLVVDLSAVGFIDSTGVASLVHAQRELRSGRFAIARAPGGVVGRLFERIRAEQIFAVYDRVDDAFLALR